MKIFLPLLSILFLTSSVADAQYASQNEAVYMATLKAVVNYKIDDEDNLKNVEQLRSNQHFMQDLSKMMSKLSNRRAKNSLNNRVYKILLKAGKEIYQELN
ncbi:MAG: hypothetical protein IJ184_04125 [Alphaproteobacteria bacterium]|nr:hypothetical protein [Alphaproteobacteria bacterium]